MSWCVGWCIKCYETKRKKRLWRGHGWSGPTRPKDKKGYKSMKFKKPNGPKTAQSKDELWADVTFARDYPCLHAFLSQTGYEGGGERQTGSIILFTERGILKACLSDRDNNRMAFLSGSTYDELLLSLETALLDDSADWRVKKSTR